VWWDAKLQSQIQRAGPERLLAYLRDLVNDRGMAGDGIIELKKIRA
jgi:hypothetical protein